MAYAEAKPRLDARRLVFVDESGCAPGQRLGYGYALRGQRCYERALLRPKGRVNMLGWMAASCGEVVLYRERVTGAVFERFVRESLVPSLDVGDIVIWDNARVHTAAAALVEAAGAVVLALPRYSPKWNAIEHLWSNRPETRAEKQYVRKVRADTGEALRTALHAAMSKVTARDAAGWIEHYGYTINATG